MVCNVRHIIVLISAFFLTMPMLNASQVSVKTSLDSAYILMGKQTTMHIEIIQEQNVSGRLLNATDTLTKEVEVIKLLPADTIDLGSNRNQILQDVIIQSFDSGLYSLPPMAYIVGRDTFYSNALALKVLPVSVDSLQTIHDYQGVVEPNTRFYDYLPDFITEYWWIYLIIIIIATAIFVYFKYFKKGKIILVPKKKEIPPYEFAIQQLTKLREEHLCERGHEKEYYTRLTDILRVYLEKRFGINAMEMTTTQIISVLENNDDTKSQNKYMRQVLEIADFVKFAKVRPIPDDNVKSFQSAMQFVEETRPIIVEQEPHDQNTEININDNNLEKDK